MPTLEQIFPPFALRVTCGPLTMRPIRDDDLPSLAQAALAGVHAPDLRPFGDHDWSDAPAEEIPLAMAQWYWQNRASFTPAKFRVIFLVEVEGRVVGCQDLAATDYTVRRSPVTGSWLSLPEQGKGYGKLMRQAVLGLAFDHLGALEMRSTAYADNAASNAVSRACGYQPDGQFLDSRDGRPTVHLRWRCTPETYVRPAHEVVVDGAEGFARFIDLPGAGPAELTPRGA